MKEIYKANKPQKHWYSPSNWDIGEIEDAIAKAVASIVLIVSSAYGFRMALTRIDDRLAFGVTGLIMLCLIYVMTRRKRDGVR